MLTASPYREASTAELIPLNDSASVAAQSPPGPTSDRSPASPQASVTSAPVCKETAPLLPRRNQLGWLIPSGLSVNPEEARAAIALPEFDPLLLEKARVISSRFPLAEGQY